MLLASVSTAVIVMSGVALAGLDVRVEVDILAETLQGEGCCMCRNPKQTSSHGLHTA